MEGEGEDGMMKGIYRDRKIWGRGINKVINLAEKREQALRIAIGTTIILVLGLFIFVISGDEASGTVGNCDDSSCDNPNYFYQYCTASSSGGIGAGYVCRANICRVTLSTSTTQCIFDNNANIEFRDYYYGNSIPEVHPGNNYVGNKGYGIVGDVGLRKYDIIG